MNQSFAVLVSFATGPIICEQLSGESREEFVTRVSGAGSAFYFIEVQHGYAEGSEREVIRGSRPEDLSDTTY